jgi:hypothetical protein
VSCKVFVFAILRGNRCFDMFYTNTRVRCCCKVVAAAMSIPLIAILSRSGNAMIGNRQRKVVRICCYEVFLFVRLTVLRVESSC